VGDFALGFLGTDRVVVGVVIAGRDSIRLIEGTTEALPQMWLQMSKDARQGRVGRCPYSLKKEAI